MFLFGAKHGILLTYHTSMLAKPNKKRKTTENVKTEEVFDMVNEEKVTEKKEQKLPSGSEPLGKPDRAKQGTEVTQDTTGNQLLSLSRTYIKQKLQNKSLVYGNNGRNYPATNNRGSCCKV